MNEDKILDPPKEEIIFTKHREVQAKNKELLAENNRLRKSNKFVRLSCIILSCIAIVVTAIPFFPSVDLFNFSETKPNTIVVEVTNFGKSSSMNSSMGPYGKYMVKLKNIEGANGKIEDKGCVIDFPLNGEGDVYIGHFGGSCDSEFRMLIDALNHISNEMERSKSFEERIKNIKATDKKSSYK